MPTPISITPDPAIHNYPPGYQSVPPRDGLIKGFAEQFIAAIINRLLEILTGGLLGPDAGTLSNNAATFLVDLFTGNLPGAVDALDGTAIDIGNMIVGNLDGTATLLANAVNGYIVSNGVVTIPTTPHLGLQNWANVLRGTNVPAVSQLTSALSGIVPAALDNVDGTASQIGSQVVQNFDGTATYVATTASTAVNSLIDNLDGTAMSFFHAMSQGVNSTLGGLLHAFSGSPVSGTVTTQAQQAQVSAAAAALQQRLATIGNGGEEFVDVEFSAYSNGSLPGIFNVVSGSGITINNGVATQSGTGLSEIVLYNGSTLSDYQQITGVFPTVTGTTVLFGLFGRSSPTLTAVTAKWTNNAASWPGGGSTWLLAAAGGTLEVTFTDTFTAGATYSLVCGDPVASNPYKFQILKNGTPLPLAAVLAGDTSQLAGQLYYIDTGQISSIGASNRECGFQMNTGTAGTITMSSFKFQDTSPGLPSAFVSTAEATSNTSYVDLATVSDVVAVSIGSSGLAQVNMSSGFVQTTGATDNYLTFQASGANTIAASDTNALIWPTGAAAAQVGTSLLLTGLSPGLTSFKLKYRVSGGTCTFSNRRIGVIAF